MEELKSGVEKTNAMFNLELAVDWRIKPEEGTNNGNVDNNGNV